MATFGGLEVLFHPLDPASKAVTIPSAPLRGQFPVSRAQGSLTFPANFMLVGAQNPCPCGYWSDPEHACSCSPKLNCADQHSSAVISRYQKRFSGPLLDRIDIHEECMDPVLVREYCARWQAVSGVEEAEQQQATMKIAGVN